MIGFESHSSRNLSFFLLFFFKHYAVFSRALLFLLYLILALILVHLYPVYLLFRLYPSHVWVVVVLIFSGISVLCFSLLICTFGFLSIFEYFLLLVVLLPWRVFESIMHHFLYIVCFFVGYFWAAPFIELIILTVKVSKSVILPPSPLSQFVCYFHLVCITVLFFNLVRSMWLWFIFFGNVCIVIYDLTNITTLSFTKS